MDSPIGSLGFNEDEGSWKTMPTRLRSSRTVFLLHFDRSVPATCKPSPR